MLHISTAVFFVLPPEDEAECLPWRDVTAADRASCFNFSTRFASNFLLAASRFVLSLEVVVGSRGIARVCPFPKRLAVTSVTVNLAASRRIPSVTSFVDIVSKAWGKSWCSWDCSSNCLYQPNLNFSITNTCLYCLHGQKLLLTWPADPHWQAVWLFGRPHKVEHQEIHIKQNILDIVSASD